MRSKVQLECSIWLYFTIIQSYIIVLFNGRGAFDFDWESCALILFWWGSVTVHENSKCLKIIHRAKGQIFGSYCTFVLRIVLIFINIVQHSNLGVLWTETSTQQLGLSAYLINSLYVDTTSLPFHAYHLPAFLQSVREKSLNWLCCRIFWVIFCKRAAFCKTVAQNFLKYFNSPVVNDGILLNNRIDEWAIFARFCKRRWRCYISKMRVTC